MQRPLAKGDVIRLRVNLPADTVKGVRAMQIGHEFEVIHAADGYVKCWDGCGVKSLLPEHAFEFVRAAHSPPADGLTDAAGKRASSLPVRRGLGRPAEVGS